jgi:hypothetical protein
MATFNSYAQFSIEQLQAECIRTMGNVREIFPKRHSLALAKYYVTEARRARNALRRETERRASPWVTSGADRDSDEESKRRGGQW